MILVDSSVWIDYFNGIESSETNTLDSTLGVQPVATGDLILVEVIATFCIENKLPLLFSDKDFKPFVEHLNLVEA